MKWGMDELLLMLGIRKGSAVVDIGFGNADELRALAEIVGDGGKVYGIEREKDRVEEASKELESVGNVTVLRGDALGVPLPDRSADYVVIKGVLHEVPHVWRALVEAARLCKQPGTILIVDFTAFPKYWLTKSNLKWRLGGPRKFLGKPLDKHPGFSRKSLEAHLRSAGLKMQTYNERIMMGSFGGHRIPMFLAALEPACDA
jgi:ubiquinone/menaquinone biosynthesis C-methylase UbiE